MLRLVAHFFVSSLTPRSAIRLGELLIEFGQAAEARLARVEKAIQALRASITTLTEK